MLCYSNATDEEIRNTVQSVRIQPLNHVPIYCIGAEVVDAYLSDDEHHTVRT